MPYKILVTTVVSSSVHTLVIDFPNAQAAQVAADAINDSTPAAGHQTAILLF